MKDFTPKTKQDRLAWTIAQGLGEQEFVAIFRSLVLHYPEKVIQRAYEEALAFPAAKVRKSRGAIFNYLVKKYARQNEQAQKDPRD
jgi:hypothetical protein